REYAASLDKLRRGMFAPKNKGRTDITETDEGYPLSASLLAKGYIEPDEIGAFPCATAHAEGIHPVIECTQNIPCNPCQDACHFGCISVGEDIVKLPVVDRSKACTGCGMCVASCSGQAIFLVDETFEPGYASVGIPYEFVPVPKAGSRGRALNRAGEEVCDAEVVSVKYTKAMDKTVLLTMKVPVAYASEARFYRE
ncbi:MAG: 4Fe-4S dicluster domain-containing protein, partial [Coriobacteriales bacterium]